MFIFINAHLHCTIDDLFSSTSSFTNSALKMTHDGHSLVCAGVYCAYVWRFLEAYIHLVVVCFLYRETPLQLATALSDGNSDPELR
jgi:hypothetical protein